MWCRQLLLVATFFILHALAQNPCPTWSAWSSARNCDQKYAICESAYVVVMPKLTDKLRGMVKSKLEAAISRWKYTASGTAEDVKYDVLNFAVSRAAITDVQLSTPSASHLKLTLPKTEVYLKYDLKATTAAQVETYTATANYKYTKLEVLLSKRGNQGDMNLSSHPSSSCVLQSLAANVNVQSGTNEALAKIFGSNGYHEIEMRKAIQNLVCAETQKMAADFVARYFSGPQILPVASGVNVVYPVYSFKYHGNALYVNLLAFTQYGRPKTTAGFGTLQAGLWRQMKMQNDFTLLRQNNYRYTCLDNRFMASISYTPYFFNEFFAEAFEARSLHFDTSESSNRDLLTQLQFSCRDGCAGSVLPHLAEKYPNALLGFKYTVKSPPTVDFDKGGDMNFRLYLNGGLLRISVVDNVTHNDLLWLGTADVDFNAWCTPYADNSRVHHNCSTDHYGIKMDHNNLLYIPSNPSVNSMLPHLVSQFLMEPIEKALEPGLPLPKPSNAEIVNATITSVHFHLLQVSMDFRFT